MPVPDPVSRWRPLRPEDLPALTKIAARVHPAFPEDDAVLAEKLALAPGWCFGLAEEKALYGYVLSHPWRGPPPKLDTLLGALPSAPTAGYIHDLALLPEARGGRHGVAIVKHLIEKAKSERLAALALVAVSGSVPFWERQAFRAVSPSPDLSSYGPDARFMRLPLSA